MDLRDAIGWLLEALACAGIAYQIIALALLRRFFDRPAPIAAATRNEAVTLLKPLHGAEPRLAENLATFLAQDHAGPVQMVCGVGSPSDGAIPAVETLRARHPDAGIALVIDGARHGANGKVGNLVNMMRSAGHDVLILSDSDMVVSRDYLSRVLAALEQPGTGAVSCLYVGRGDAGFWSRVGAGAISYQMMPNMVLGLVTGMAKPCMGSTIALRREVLEAIGGFARFADVLADDHAIGVAVAERGLKVAVPPMLLTHAGDEADFAELWRHHLRWAVTIRDLAGPSHYGSVVTHALPLALLSACFAPGPGLALAAAALAARLQLARAVDRISARRLAPAFFLPLIDCLGFLVYGASLFARKIDWRGSRLTMADEGRIIAPSKRD